MPPLLPLLCPNTSTSVISGVVTMVRGVLAVKGTGWGAWPATLKLATGCSLQTAYGSFHLIRLPIPFENWGHTKPQLSDWTLLVHHHMLDEKKNKLARGNVERFFFFFQRWSVAGLHRSWVGPVVGMQGRCACGLQIAVSLKEQLFPPQTAFEGLFSLESCCWCFVARHVWQSLPQSGKDRELMFSLSLSHSFALSLFLTAVSFTLTLNAIS